MAPSTTAADNAEDLLDRIALKALEALDSSNTREIVGHLRHPSPAA
jgi:hypothetical protein